MTYRTVFILLASLCWAFPSFAQTYSVPQYADSVQNTADKLKAKPLIAAVQTFGINLFVWSADRIYGADFSKISLSSIEQNVTHKWVWDNDQMNTNLFGHPYHGGLYFTAARSNGMNFWQSIFFSFGGSLMWETCMENEPPAFNDLMASSLGGPMFGEILFRLSSAAYDDSKTGMARFGRELLGGLLSPMQGFNRILTGQAWKIQKKDNDEYRPENPEKVWLSLGERYLSENGSFSTGTFTSELGLRTEYGDPFDKDSYQPYDWFNAEANFCVGGNQPTIGSASAVGLITGTSLELPHSRQMVLGIFQHFNYFDSKPTSSGLETTPYQIAETVSFGPGLLFRFNPESNRLNFIGAAYASFVALGASWSDHFKLQSREYNMGQGFSINLNAKVKDEGVGDIGIKLYNLNIYTWKGYPDGLDINSLTEEQQDYLLTQGDKGRTSIFVINPTCDIDLTPSLDLAFEYRDFIRLSHYKYFPFVNYSTFDAKVSLEYTF